MIHSLITLFSRLLRGDDPAATNQTIFERAQDCPILFQHDSINLEAELFQYFYFKTFKACDYSLILFDKNSTDVFTLLNGQTTLSEQFAIARYCRHVRRSSGLVDFL